MRQIDAVKAEDKAREMAYYVVPEYTRAHTGSGPLSVLVVFRCPSFVEVGKWHYVTVHRPRRSDVLSKPEAKDWALWECNCEWATHHSAGPDGVNACAHLRAARIWQRVQELGRETIGVDWWGRIRDDWVSVANEPLLVPQAVIAANRDAMASLEGDLKSGKIGPLSERYVAARHAAGVLVQERRLSGHMAPREEI